MDFPSVIVHYPSRAGLMVENLTLQLGEFFGVKNGQGVLVRSVQKGSVAEAAGFKAGDVIVRVGNTRINDASDWRMAMRDHRSGAVSIGVIRDKREQNLSLKMPERRQGRNATQTADIEANIDFSELEKEMQQLQPELEQARAQVQVATQQATQEFLKNQAKWRHEAEKACEQARKEIERQQKILQEQMKKMQKEMRQQIDEI
jgi:membrane-associated protease RseP (regulator of RpoE activity)